MRFDLRLLGKTDAGRDCVMELTVYARGQEELLERVQQVSTEGPWYYRGDSEAVPTSEKITVEGIENLTEKKGPAKK